MDRWRQEALRSANNGLRNQIERILDTYEEQRPRLAEMLRQLESARVQVNSPDRSVEVVVDGGGVLTDLTLTATALRRTPDQLAATIVEAVQEAARSAREQHENLTAPAADDTVPDLPDILPEAPSFHEVRAFFRDDDYRAR
ncbi:YbaB/EbfC family nucleoid-associated protein [Nocardia sp. NPDC050799]|uniref:YbaB/EbfC family nucleoid-associated protein n=1 Tax=Nocardia sp. NPDC050799 TaxID=3154842 RepID=UPI0033DC280D